MSDKNILIVEDEKKIADTLKIGLEENGYQVDVAYDGSIGYSLFSTRRFDLALLDINLPGMTAMNCARHSVRGIRKFLLSCLPP